MTQQHSAYNRQHDYLHNPHATNEIPRIADERYKPEYRDDPKASEVWIEWIFPISGWFAMITNGLIVGTVVRSNMLYGYDIAASVASMGCFVMTLFALIVIYKYREFVYNIRTKKDV